MLLMPIRSEETTAPERTASKFTAATGVVRRAADPLMMVGGALLAYRIRYGSFRMDTDHISRTVLTRVFGLLVFGSSSLYRSWRGLCITTEQIGRASW